MLCLIDEWSTLYIMYMLILNVPGLTNLRMKYKYLANLYVTGGGRVGVNNMSSY